MSKLKGKFALVTGGAQGIGLACIREFLANGIEGITLVDVNDALGHRSKDELNKTYSGKVIFINADVGKPDQLEDSFKASISHWKYVDIVFNNAGVVDEENWERELSVNCKGVAHGVTFGFKYMSKVVNGRGGIIINTSSMAGIDPQYSLPFYSATKCFVAGLGRAFGTPTYFNYTGVKVITVCPGLTTTSILDDALVSTPVSICPNVQEEAKKGMESVPSQTAESVAKAVISVIEKANNGSVWIVEGGDPLYEIEFPLRYHMKKLKPSTTLVHNKCNTEIV